MALGWVYVLSNPSMPGLVKIGQSSNDPELRADDLYTTGVPTRFRVEYKGLYEGYASLERRIHTRLSEARASESREFFRIDVEEAIGILRQVAGAEPHFEEIKYVNPAELERRRLQAEKEAAAAREKARLEAEAAERERRRLEEKQKKDRQKQNEFNKLIEQYKEYKYEQNKYHAPYIYCQIIFWISALIMFGVAGISIITRDTTSENALYALIIACLTACFAGFAIFFLHGTLENSKDITDQELNDLRKEFEKMYNENTNVSVAEFKLRDIAARKEAISSSTQKITNNIYKNPVFYFKDGYFNIEGENPRYLVFSDCRKYIQQDTYRFRCSSCNALNRLPKQRHPNEGKCGTCGSVLTRSPQKNSNDESRIIKKSSGDMPNGILTIGHFDKCGCLAASGPMLNLVCR